MNLRSWVPTVMLLCGLATPALGSGRVRLSAAMESWSWDVTADDTRTLNEMTTRAMVGIDVTRAFQVQVATGLVRADWDNPAEGEIAADTEVSGLVDTQVRLVYRRGNRWIARLGFNGATGQTELSPGEMDLARALASRALAFEGSRLGEGADFDLGISYALPLGKAAIGLGAAYLHKGQYTFDDLGTDYQPGSQTSLAAGADLANPRWLWRTNTRLILFSDDQLASEAVYRTGHRLDLQTMLLRRWGPTSLWGSASLITYGKARLMPGSESETKEVARGDELYMDAGVKRMLTRRVSLSLMGGVRRFATNDNGEGEAMRTDLGGELNARLSNRLAFNLRGRHGFGTAKQVVPELRSQADADLSGFRARAALTLDF